MKGMKRYRVTGTKIIEAKNERLAVARFPILVRANRVEYHVEELP